MVIYSRLYAGRFFMGIRDIRIPDKTADKDAALKEPFRLAVIGACRGAGCSFVSLRALQKGLYEGHTPEGLRTLCELGSPYFYTALGFDKRFAGRSFCDYSSHGRHELNMEMGYNWYLRKADQKGKKDAEILRSFYNAAGAFVVYDCSGLMDEEVLYDVLEESDRIYLVIDPLPTRLISSQGFIEEIRTSFPKSELVVNKYAKGIHKGELSAFLGTRSYHAEPFMPIERIYKAEYNCRLI